MEDKKREIKEHVRLMTFFDDDRRLDYYTDKIVIKVLDYCRREDLNVPLLTFIEEKLINIIKQIMKDESSGGAINGIDMKNIKSISRGDTSITLQDNKSIATDFSDLSAKDYLFLNRHRKVYRS